MTTQRTADFTELFRGIKHPTLNVYYVTLALTTVAQTAVMVWGLVTSTDVLFFRLSVLHIHLVSLWFAKRSLECLEDRRTQKPKRGGQFAAYCALIPVGLAWPLVDLVSSLRPSAVMQTQWRLVADYLREEGSTLKWNTVSNSVRRLLQPAVISRAAQYCARSTFGTQHRAFGVEGLVVTLPQLVMHLWLLDAPFSSTVVLIASLALRAPLFEHVLGFGAPAGDERLHRFVVALAVSDVLTGVFRWLPSNSANTAGAEVLGLHSALTLCAANSAVCVFLVGAFFTCALGRRSSVGVADLFWTAVAVLVAAGIAALVPFGFVPSFLGTTGLYVLCCGGLGDVFETGRDLGLTMLHCLELSFSVVNCLASAPLCLLKDAPSALCWDFVRDGFDVSMEQGERRLRDVVRHTVHQVIRLDIPTFQPGKPYTGKHKEIAHQVQCILHALEANRIHLHDCCAPAERDGDVMVDWRRERPWTASQRSLRDFLWRSKTTPSRKREWKAHLQSAIRSLAAVVFAVLFVPVNIILPMLYAAHSGWANLSDVQLACFVGHLLCYLVAAYHTLHAYRYFTFSNAMSKLVLSLGRYDLDDALVLLRDAYDPSPAESLRAAIASEVLPRDVVETELPPFLIPDDVVLQPTVADVLRKTVSALPQDVVELIVAPYLTEDHLEFSRFALADCWALKHPSSPAA